MAKISLAALVAVSNLITPFAVTVVKALVAEMAVMAQMAILVIMAVLDIRA